MAALTPKTADSSVGLEHLLPSAESTKKFAFRVLDVHGGHLASGRVVRLSGRTLIAQTSEHMRPDTCVRIDCDDAFLLGEVLGCWRDGPAILVAVKLLESLIGLEKRGCHEEYRDSLMRT